MQIVKCHPCMTKGNHINYLVKPHDIPPWREVGIGSLRIGCIFIAFHLKRPNMYQGEYIRGNATTTTGEEL